jgi:transcriptional regulator with XRE-family HTH domain
VSPREAGTLQEKILDGIKKQSDGAPDKQIAAHAGVDRTQLSKWRTGERVMRLDELCNLLPAYGAAAVLGPIAALDEADVVERDPKGPADPRALSLSLTLRMAELSSVVHLALADNIITPDELAALTSKAEGIVLDLRRLQAGARDAA